MRKAEQIIRNFENKDDSILYCLYIINKNTNDLMMLAINTIEKYVIEKWDKIENNNDKYAIRLYLLTNLFERLKYLNTNLSEKKKQYLISSINKINCIIVLIASKDWPQSWPNLIKELCDIPKKELSYISENCIKVLLLLSDHLNRSYKKLMTANKNIQLSYKMYEELNKILSLIKYLLVEKSDEIVYHIINKNENNYINNNNNYNYNGDKNMLKNILKQTIKLFEEFINWFDIENILDKSIIQKLLFIFKNNICNNEIIDCFGSLFKFEINKLEGHNTEKVRELIFDIYDSFIEILYNDIVKRKNFLEQYELINNTQIEKNIGFENFTIKVENCLINFFNENFNFIKEKSVYSTEFLNKYNNSISIGLRYLIQFTIFKHEQIQINAIEFWYFIVSNLFTLKNFINNKDNSANNNIIEDKKILSDYLKKSNIYNICFVNILDKLREVICYNINKPLEIKNKLDKNNCNFPEDNYNDSFNENLQETMQNIIIYLSIIEPEKTEKLIIDTIVNENNKSSMNLNKINSLCWSSGLISGTMDENLENKFIICICKLLFTLLKKSEKKNKEILACNLMFIISKYKRFLNKHIEFVFVIYKKLLDFFQLDSSYVKDFACETFVRLSINSEDIIQNNQKKGIEFIEFLFNNFKDYTKHLNSIQIIMVYESLANIINKLNDQKLKQNYFVKLIEKPNKIFNEIQKNKNINLNYLNNLNNIKKLKFFITINQKLCNSLKKFYWLYGSTIFKETINLFLYYNEELNILINNNYNNNNDEVKKKSYELLNNSILNYFTCLVKNINDIDIIKNDMIIDFGILLDKFGKSSIKNKNPNILLLFAAIIEINKNNNDELNCRIWEFFDSNIFNLIKAEGDFLPDLTENFFVLIKSLITNSTETFFIKYKYIPVNLIDILNYGVNSLIPHIYEKSLETLKILIENIFKININGFDQKNIIKQFYDNYFDRIFYFVFGNMIDGYHQNGINEQIKILELLTKKLDDKDIFNITYKNVFQQKLINDIPKIGNNLTLNQIETFTLALFNYSHNSHYFEITIKDFLVSLNTFNKKDDIVSEEEKMHQIRLAREIEIKKYIQSSNNKDNISIDNYRNDDFLNLNLSDF